MPPPDPLSREAVADRLRMTREALGLNQAEMGRRVGISAQAWSNNELGRDLISLKQAMKICVATGVGLDWIYRGLMHGLPHDLAVKINSLPAPKEKRSKRA